MMLNRFLFLCLLCTFPTFITANAQIRPEQHAQLRAALERDDERTAETLLREMKKAAPEAFAQNNYDYLLARLLMRRDANIEANQLLQSVVARNSVLASYALWHQAEIARVGGNAKEEQRLLQRFLSPQSGAPADHLYRERAIQRLGESYFRGGQYQSVISLLRGSASVRRDYLALIGEAQAALRQNDAARASFESALAGTAQDDTSLRAARGLDRINELEGAMLSEAEHLRRARIYQFNRYFGDARKHWLAVVSQFPQSPKRSEALFQLGRGYFLEDNFSESAKWYAQVHKEFPSTPEGEQGFYYVGHCYQYLGDADRAIARYEEFLRVYPRSEYVGYAHLNAIDTLRTAGRNEEALKWAARGMAVSDAFTAVTAHFKQALIHLAQEDYLAALADFTALRSRNLSVRGQVATTNGPEVAFLRAYCLEKQGRYEDALTEYLALPELRGGAAGYYGWRASERLRALTANLRAKNMAATRRDKFVADARAAHSAGNAAVAKTAAQQALRFLPEDATNPLRRELLSVLKTSYGKLRGYQPPSLTVTRAGRAAPLSDGESVPAVANHQTLASELLFLGLYDEGASELLEAGAPRTTAAFYCARGNCAKLTFEVGEPLLAGLPDDYRLELLPRETAEIFYPLPFRAALAQYAVPRGVDPRFVLSIARQESSYNPRVKSASAARGLMQFIAQTSNQIAGQLRLRDFEQNDLYNPEVAVLFGSQYLKNLFEEFGTPQAVAAAYNGSEDSVRRWLARARSTDPDRFVGEVLKRETKDYVFKVTGNYLAYQKCYPNVVGR